MSILLYRNYFYHASANNALSHFTLVIVASAIGYGAAAVLTPALSERLPPGALITVLLALAGIVAAPLGATFSQVPFLVVSFVVSLAAQGVAITATTIIQQDVDDGFRGRVFSFYDMLFNAPFVVGAALAAAFMPFDGKSYALLAVAGGGYLLAALAYALLSLQPAGGGSPPSSAVVSPSATAQRSSS
jgi:sugar phosphate permease